MFEVRCLLAYRNRTWERVDFRQPSSEPFAIKTPVIKRDIVDTVKLEDAELNPPILYKESLSTTTSHLARRAVIVVRNLIIVDDNPAVRRALSELFAREEDFRVCGQATNGRDAIEKAQQLNPDLIVTDLSMPIMNGLEEARVLSQIMPTVPVIIYTAHWDPFIERQARLAGVSAVVSKFESVATLLATARNVFYQIAA